MSEMPLAEDMVFLGPVASSDSAAGYRAMARQAGAAVTSFRVRHQFTHGNLVCSVVDWTMAPVQGILTAAEVLEVRDGRIVRGELITTPRSCARPWASARPDERLCHVDAQWCDPRAAPRHRLENSRQEAVAVGRHPGP